MSRRCSSRFSAILFAVALAITLPPGLAAQQHTQSADSPSTENQVFDANRESPLPLLRKLYEEKKVLLLGEPDHEHETTYKLLLALLKEVGSDPRLKYIVVERSQPQAPLYADLSVNHMSEADIKEKLVPQEGLTVCGLTMALTFGMLLPPIQVVNSMRTPEKKVLLTGIDGIPSNSGIEETFIRSIQREIKTSENFRDHLWASLGPSDKMIVMYHQAHIIKGFTQSFRPPAGEIGANWLSIFLRQHPSAAADMAVVLVEYDTEGDQDGTMLKFTQRQAARYPKESWAVRLAPFANVTTERGMEVLTPESFLDQWFGNGNPSFLHPGGEVEFGTPSSASTLPDMADAIIWRSDVADEMIKPPSEYLPLACSE